MQNLVDRVNKTHRELSNVIVHGKLPINVRSCLCEILKSCDGFENELKSSLLGTSDKSVFISCRIFVEKALIQLFSFVGKGCKTNLAENIPLVSKFGIFPSKSLEIFVLASDVVRLEGNGSGHSFDANVLSPHTVASIAHDLVDLMWKYMINSLEKKEFKLKQERKIETNKDTKQKVFQPLLSNNSEKKIEKKQEEIKTPTQSFVHTFTPPKFGRSRENNEKTGVNPSYRPIYSGNSMKPSTGNQGQFDTCMTFIAGLECSNKNHLHSRASSSKMSEVYSNYITIGTRPCHQGINCDHFKCSVILNDGRITDGCFNDHFCQDPSSHQVKRCLAYGWKLFSYELIDREEIFTNTKTCWDLRDLKPDLQQIIAQHRNGKYAKSE